VKGIIRYFIIVSKATSNATSRHKGDEVPRNYHDHFLVIVLRLRADQPVEKLGASYESDGETPSGTS
jgi:hypothetical protein